MARNRTDLSSFGPLLKSFRTRRRLTQQHLATAVGVHRNAIGRWEQGDVLPASKAIVLELANHLRLDDQETRHFLEASLTALAPHWSVPLPRNPFFTGREEVLETLHTHLGSDQAVALTQSSALQGLGGVGKTQIALEYAYRHAMEYSAVFWIEAETDEQIVASLLRIAETLQVPEREDQDHQRVVAAVQRWLSSHRHWLLVWDNVEDLDVLQRFLPSSRSGAILITTRSQALGTLARSLDLAPMEREEGILLLLRRAKLVDQETKGEQIHPLAERIPAQYAPAAELVPLLGGLPLALDQAGAYVEETQCGVSTYLDLFRVKRAALLQLRGEGSRDHPASVSTTFTLAITATARRHPAVRDLLQVCALLQPDAIPEELFRQTGEQLGPTLQAVCGDPLEWNRVVSVACGYSLLARQPEEQTLSLHRLVQAVLLDEMTEAERELWNRRMIEALDQIFSEALPATKQAARKQGERVLPQVLWCLHQTEEGESCQALASLAWKAAQYLHECGRYQEAEPHYLRVLSIREQQLGPEHSEVAQVLNALAIVSREQGRYREAEPHFLRALSIREQQLGPGHPEVARSLNSLAVLYWQQAKYPQAEPLLQRALAIWDQTFGPEHPQMARPLYNLAHLYQEQGKYEQAETLFQRSLRIEEQAWGPDYPDLAYPLIGLAELYQKQGQDKMAEPLLQRALRLWEEALGPEHLLLFYPLANLAISFQRQGEYGRAESFLLRALGIAEQALGSDHPEVALSLNSLANLYAEQGKDEQAEPLYQRAVSIQEQALGPEHPNLAASLTDLANLFRDQGDFAQAEPLYQRACSIREQQLGLRHPETAETLHHLALLRQKQGLLSEARAFAERARSIRSQALGDVHPKTVATQALYAQLLQEQAGRAEPTVEHLRSLLKARGWSLHLKKRRDKPYVYATRKVGKHTQSRYLAPLSNLAVCLAAVGALPNAKKE